METPIKFQAAVTNTVLTGLMDLIFPIKKQNIFPSVWLTYFSAT